MNDLNFNVSNKKPEGMIWKISPNVKIQMPNQCQSPNVKVDAVFILDFDIRI